MFDSMKLNDLHSYATVIAVFAVIVFIAMLVVQKKYNKIRLGRIAKENLQTENADVKVISHKTVNEKAFRIGSISLRIICALMILASMGLIFYSSVINKMALANGAYDNIQYSQTIGEIKEDVKYGFEESDDLPDDLTGCIVIFFRYGCPDCKGIHDDLMKRVEEHKDNKIYFVSTRSSTGSKLLHPDGDMDKYLVNDVPAIVYYQSYDVTNPVTKKSVLYTFDENKNPILDEMVFDAVIKYQEQGSVAE